MKKMPKAEQAEIKRLKAALAATHEHLNTVLAFEDRKRDGIYKEAYLQLEKNWQEDGLPVTVGFPEHFKWLRERPDLKERGYPLAVEA